MLKLIDSALHGKQLSQYHQLWDEENAAIQPFLLCLETILRREMEHCSITRVCSWFLLRYGQYYAKVFLVLVLTHPKNDHQLTPVDTNFFGGWQATPISDPSFSVRTQETSSQKDLTARCDWCHRLHPQKLLIQWPTSPSVETFP